MENQVKNIKEIFPRTRKWTAKVLVAEKRLPRTSTRNSSRYQHLLLVDVQGTRIQATIFDDNIERFENTLIMFKTYNISNAIVNRIMPAHRVIDNQYQWIINDKTKINEVSEEEALNNPQDAPNFTFVPFSALNEYKHRAVEIDTSLCTKVSNRLIIIDPDLPEAFVLRAWRDENEKFLQMCMSEKTLVSSLSNIAIPENESIIPVNAIKDLAGKDGIHNLASIADVSSCNEYIAHLKTYKHDYKQQTKYRYTVLHMLDAASNK
ncbi:Nucleic acid-binding, OB-fold containing protein [Trema orientale]|uniref:Nucleic acid-binding, OB-fold containing protein n=1 Tax=Trema orientale TaxID=63057 RepID=A0A2P5DHX3_TREOI|nr:Nucleic acid-binding, OB-fold containing protein [Trema orientale]